MHRSNEVILNGYVVSDPSVSDSLYKPAYVPNLDALLGCGLSELPSSVD